VESVIVGLKSRVQKGVDKAFAKVDELLKDCVFTNTPATAFDFETSENVSSTTTFTIRGYVMSKTSKVGEGLVTRTLLLVKTPQLDFTGYSKVLIDSVVYTCSVKESDDFITTFEIVRS
jgi:hypothetical protein